MLQTVDLNSLRDYVHRAAAHSGSNAFKENVEEFLRESHLAVADSVDLSTNAAVPVIFKYPPLDASLVEVDKYFNSDHFIYVFEPNTTELKEQLAESLTSVKLERKDAGRKAKSFAVTKVTLKDDSSQVQIEQMQKAVDEVGGTSPESIPANALFDLEIRTDLGESVRSRQISGRLVPLDEETFKVWFRRQPAFKDLAITSPENPETYAVFPKLHVVWNEVLTATPNGALVALEDKRKSGRQQVSFLGLSVEESIAIIAGPAALLMTMLYLFVHLRHIASFSEAHGEELKSYPWIALFPDKMSRALTLASLVALPLLANSILLVRSWTAKRPIEWFALVLAIFSIICGVRLSINILRLGRQLKSA